MAMTLDVRLDAALSDVGAAVQALAEAGVGGAFTYEGPGDPFLPLGVAAAAGTGLTLYSNLVKWQYSPLHDQRMAGCTPSRHGSRRRVLGGLTCLDSRNAPVTTSRINHESGETMRTVSARSLWARSSGKTLAAVLTGGGVIASGFVLSPAEAASCGTKSQTIYTSYINIDAEQAGKASNSNCSGTGNLQVRIQHQDTFGRDETVSSSNWQVSLNNYERVVYGCRTRDAQYFSEQILDGSKKKSTVRTFKSCQVQ